MAGGRERKVFPQVLFPREVELSPEEQLLERLRNTRGEIVQGGPSSLEEFLLPVGAGAAPKFIAQLAARQAPRQLGLNVAPAGVPGGRVIEGVVRSAENLARQRLKSPTIHRAATAKAFKRGEGLGGTKFSRFVSAFKEQAKRVKDLQKRADRGEVPSELAEAARRNLSSRLVGHLPFSDRRRALESAMRVDDIFLDVFGRAFGSKPVRKVLEKGGKSEAFRRRVGKGAPK